MKVEGGLFGKRKEIKGKEKSRQEMVMGSKYSNS
jgi:hypothetical protein